MRKNEQAAIRQIRRLKTRFELRFGEEAVGLACEVSEAIPVEAGGLACTRSQKAIPLEAHALACEVSEVIREEAGGPVRGTRKVIREEAAARWLFASGQREVLGWKLPKCGKCSKQIPDRKTGGTAPKCIPPETRRRAMSCAG